MTDKPAVFTTSDNVYKTLLESTKAIPWKINWKTLQFEYIGPQIEALLGWEPTSWLTVNDWADRMHPEDRAWVVDFCVSQSQSGTDHEADYRALTQSGDYVWIRDVVHVVRDRHGEVEALIGFMFDISERKQTEQKLLDLQQQLEEMSFQDGLTGVANRRMLDKVLNDEWLQARRSHTPLSVLLIDIDFFKQYNDCYGHLKGDDCLKQVAEVLANTATRPRDFFARFGGEEFVMVLPETNAEAAVLIAERCQQQVLQLQMVHQASSISPLLTISIGTGTTVPSHQGKLDDFINQVDRSLYQAKQLGRNRIQQA